jgi:5'(3')-deoxyribonucleotidase
MTSTGKEFVLGLDLDGVVADFYGHMRTIVEELRGIPEHHLTKKVSYGLPEWKLKKLGMEYDDVHRFAVTQRDFFRTMPVIRDAAQAVRRLSSEGIRIRIITHRLFIENFHQRAVEQTVAWLDDNAIPYWDLCFMRDKELVDADLYVEDAPKNIECLQAAGKDVIAFTNSTNMDVRAKRRADSWREAEKMIGKTYRKWKP